MLEEESHCVLDIVFKGRTFIMSEERTVLPSSEQESSCVLQERIWTLLTQLACPTRVKEEPVCRFQTRTMPSTDPEAKNLSIKWIATTPEVWPMQNRVLEWKRRVKEQRGKVPCNTRLHSKVAKLQILIVLSMEQLTILLLSNCTPRTISECPLRMAKQTPVSVFHALKTRLH